MIAQKEALVFTEKLLNNLPEDWTQLTTHRLDIYNEEKAKVEFTEALIQLFNDGNHKADRLEHMPTAYDYIRLGHPLSCILEWVLGEISDIHYTQIIAFSSQMMPLMAVLRKNQLEGRMTRLVYNGGLPFGFNAMTLKDVYGYQFELQDFSKGSNIEKFDGETVLIEEKSAAGHFEIPENVDFVLHLYKGRGAVIAMNNKDIIGEIQHVRRRESIAMTPQNCLAILDSLIKNYQIEQNLETNVKQTKSQVRRYIKEITGTTTPALIGSSGLSVQYAIMMGLIDEAKEEHSGKPIRFLVPPNCYGGTNDQARRVAASIEGVKILDLPVDGDNDMVKSIDRVLEEVAQIDGVPFIIAEIPTNPRVEVPNLLALQQALEKKRNASSGASAVSPVFILDQTFCPDFPFLKEDGIFQSIEAISYASGSKFPSGGKCTAGYCVSNRKAADLMKKIDKHLQLCDNRATPHQLSILAEQLPSMNQRIADAYENTHDFVKFIKKTLPEAKINFVSAELAAQGFTPSVFSLDLPSEGNTPTAKEAQKRKLNHELIYRMITAIPNESKYCVSYGQLKGCYWTIPATSTQGTTREGDKDYIVRASLSPDLDLEKHKFVFEKFVKECM